MARISAETALIFSCGLGIYTLLGLILFIRRRNIYPIVGRVPIIVSLISLTLSFHLISRSFLKLKSQSCRVKWIPQYLCISLAMNLFALRGYILFIRHQYTYELLLMSKASANDEDVKTWWSDHSFMRNNWVVSLLTFIWFMISSIPLVFILLFDLEDDYCDGNVIDEAFVSLTIVHIAIYLLAAYKLRKVIEGYRIKFELKIVSFAGLLGLCGLIFTSTDSYASFFISGWIPFLICNSSMIWLPVIWSYYNNQDKVTTKRQIQIEHLRDVMELPEGLQKFRKFLQGEFSVENLIFYQAVIRFKHFCREQRTRKTNSPKSVSEISVSSHRLQSNDDDVDAAAGDDMDMMSNDEAIQSPRSKSLVSSSERFLFPQSPLKQNTQLLDFKPDHDLLYNARMIYDRFISKRAPTLVNLPGTITNRLHAIFLSDDPISQLMNVQSTILEHFELNALDPVIVNRAIAHIFDDAGRNTFNLLATDSFMRFRNSHFYQDLKDKVHTHNLKIDAYNMVTNSAEKTGKKESKEQMIARYNRSDSAASFDQKHILNNNLTDAEPQLLV